MPLRIDWTLDDSEEPLDADSLLGSITLRGDRGVIHQEAIYVDSWLEALIRCMKAISRHSETRIEVEDPKPIVGILDDCGRVWIRFGEQGITANSVADVNAELRRVCEVFLTTTGRLPDSERNGCLRSLRAFLEQSS